MMIERGLRSERDLLYQLTMERPQVGTRNVTNNQVAAPNPAALASDCRNKPSELIHRELCALVREHIRVMVQRDPAISAEARDALESLCEREGTLMGSLKVRLEWARGRLPLPLWKPPARSSLECPRVHRPTAAALFNDFVCKNRPCVITGVFESSGFPPLASFKDNAYLRKRAGHRRVGVKGFFADDATSAGHRVFFNDKDKRVTLSSYLDAIDEATASGEPAPLYLAKCDLRRHLPELHADIAEARASPAAAYGSCFGSALEDGVVLYLGGGQNTTNTHFDAYENLMLVVGGTKRLLLFPPSEADRLYITRMGGQAWAYSAVPPMVAPSEGDGFDAGTFPRFAKARALEVELHEGECLYLPIFWWHGVSGSGRNLILNWWWNPRNDKLDPNAVGEKRRSRMNP